MIDFFFFYKYTLRSLLVYKSFGLTNTYSIPYVYKFLCFFSMRSIEDVDQVQIYNYSYLYKFFFGKRVFLTRQKSFFNLGKWSYSFNASILVCDYNLYHNIYFILNDILPKIDFLYLKYGFFL